jgi:flagellar basal body-associated protein FliL
MHFGRAPAAEQIGEEAEDGADEAEAAEDAEPLAPPVVYEIGSFLVNVHANDELRYLRVEVAAAIGDYEAEEEGGEKHGEGGGGDEELPALKSGHEALARDAIVRILSEAGFATLRTETGREQAKEAIRTTLAETLEGARVEKVLFLSFVMQ